MADNFDIPILFLIFNRPDTTREVFNAISVIKPLNLFVAGDGPRNKEEENKVKNTRDILNQVNWQCEVKTLFRNENLGCKTAVSTAIDWFFQHNEMGIILEDDCLPNTSFFNYCRELLIKYRDDERIMQICGFNAIDKVAIKESYYYSKFGTIWGWATWQRAWKYYDVKMKTWIETKTNKLYKQYCDSRLEELWRVDIFDRVAEGLIDTWDYQWSYAKLMHNGLSIIPGINLVNNIGFGENATHTAYSKKQITVNPGTGINFPLIHPKVIERNKKLDKEFFYKFVIKNKIIGTLSKYFGK